MDWRAWFDSPFDVVLGTEVLSATADKVTATVPVTRQLHQPDGIVHGGVFAALVETTASIGANLWLDGAAVAVGVGNHTDFLRAVRDGTLTVTATPVHQGRSLQLWRAEITDADGRLVAVGQVRLMNLRQ